MKTESRKSHICCSRPAAAEKGKPTGKRIGKSRPDKANNQLNRRIK